MYTRIRARALAYMRPSKVSLLLNLPGQADAEACRQLQLGECRFQVLNNGAEISADGVGRDVDDALEVFALDLHWSGVQLESGQVLEQDRLAVFGRGNTCSIAVRSLRCSSASQALM